MSENVKFIFDVDGTLTPSRQTIDPEFKKYFDRFCKNHFVCLVTGSDREKTIEQVTQQTYDLCHTVYQCSGMDVWQGEYNIRHMDWALEEEHKAFLYAQMAISNFKMRRGNHIEERTGLANFSVVGRNATLEERFIYSEFDEDTQERSRIARLFNEQFPELHAQVAGQIGIDITPRGYNKSQILQDFFDDDYIIFFGDSMSEEGNDYPLAMAITNGEAIAVKDYKDTWNKLKEL